jgi:hypothetical protein
MFVGTWKRLHYSYKAVECVARFDTEDHATGKWLHEIAYGHTAVSTVDIRAFVIRENYVERQINLLYIRGANLAPWNACVR